MVNNQVTTCMIPHTPTMRPAWITGQVISRGSHKVCVSWANTHYIIQRKPLFSYFLIQTTLFEWYMVGLPPRTDYHKDMWFERDWTACLQCDSHSRLNNQYNWDSLYDHLISTRIFTLTMNKICVWAPRIMREVASSLIRFANHLVLLVSSYFKRSRPVRKK